MFPFPLTIQVMIIRGKDKGETGIVKRVVRSQNRVIVEGKNLVSNFVTLYLSLSISCHNLPSLFDHLSSYHSRL